MKSDVHKSCHIICPSSPKPLKIKIYHLYIVIIYIQWLLWHLSSPNNATLTASLSGGGDAECARDQLTHVQTYKSHPFTPMAGTPCTAADHAAFNSDTK